MLRTTARCTHRPALPGRPTIGRPVRGDRGSATAETAVVLPVLVVVVLLCVWVLACVGAQLRCVDAARVAAREAARGEPVSAVVAAARPVAPAGAAVRVERRGDRVEVLVSARVRPLGRVLALLPATPVAARAVAVVEDGHPGDLAGDLGGPGSDG